MVRCYRCGQFGHIRPDCWQDSDDESSDDDSMNANDFLRLASLISQANSKPQPQPQPVVAPKPKLKLDDTVEELLVALAVPQEYRDKFAEEQIDFNAFLHLNESHLESLGIPLGYRIKILKAISDMKPKPTTPVLVQHNPMKLTKPTVVNTNTPTAIAVAKTNSISRPIVAPVTPTKPVVSQPIDILSSHYVKGVEITTEVLGEGNFGKVVRGKMNHTDCALKTLIAYDSNKELLDEAAIWQNARHPRIVSYFGLYRTSSALYIVTEYMPLGSLLSILKDQQRRQEITFNVLAQFCIHITSGIAHLHSRKIIHRDINAANVLVGKEGNSYVAKVSDFGLARFVANTNNQNTRVAYLWAAPEVLQSKQFSTHSDIWSLGMTFWEMFTYGKEPFSHLQVTNKEEFIAHLANSALPLKGNIPSPYYDLMGACWLFDAEYRPNADLLLKRLTELEKPTQPVKYKPL